MRPSLICLLFVLSITSVTAENSSTNPRIPEGSAAPRHPVEQDRNNVPTRATIVREPTQQKAESIKSTSTPVLYAFSKRCVRSGDILNFKGKNLSAYFNHNLIISIDNTTIALKRISTADNQLIYQLPDNELLKADHNYLVYLNDKSKPSLPDLPTPLKLRICSFVETNKSQTLPNNPHEPGEILVLADMTLSGDIQQYVQSQGFSVLQHHVLIGLDKTMLVIKTDERGILAAIKKLRIKFPNAVIDFNNHYQATAEPRTYAAEMISWPAIEKCNKENFKELSIGIIDGYTDQTHPALADQNITVKNFLDDIEQADKRHGTSIAVILSGNKPNLGFQGLLPHVQIFAASVLRIDNDRLIATTDAIVRSIDWLILNNVRLVNVSLSGTRPNIVLKATLAQGIKKGLIIFAAAGNNGRTADQSYPAALPNVISVTAVDAANRIYQQANQGKYIDFSAPGVDIWVINQGIQGKYGSGTSYATPHAVAVAALYLTKNRHLSRDVLYNAMQTSSKDLGMKGHDDIFGWGLLQVPNDLCH